MSQKSYDNTPTLYLIPTPIGNMDDITLRAINTLKKVEVIFCEDTRVTGLLLKHLDIKKKLISSHLYNEEKNYNKLLSYLEKGYDVAVQVDGDGQHDPKYLSNLLKCLIEEKADMVIGSRFIENQGFQSTFMRRIGIVYFTRLIRALTGKTITDPTSGFRMAGRDVIRMFATQYPKDYPEPESIVTLLKNDMKVLEVPVRMKERQGGESSIKMTNSVYYMIKVSLAILVENSKRNK